jgi:hypothetical protein
MGEVAAYRRCGHNHCSGGPAWQGQTHADQWEDQRLAMVPGALFLIAGTQLALRGRTLAGRILIGAAIAVYLGWFVVVGQYVVIYS